MSHGKNRRESSDEHDSTEGKSTGNMNVTRRRLLASGAATWATVALAGCGGDDGETPTETATETEAETAAETDTETATETDTETATETDTETATATPENYVVTTETWTGGGVPAPISFMSSCARSDTFVPGMQVVFFVGIFDPDTGDLLTDDDLSGTQVNVGDGMETLDLEWTDEHSHATRNEGNNWVGSWDVPEDMSPQSLSYTVEVTNGDADFQNVGVLTDGIEVVEYDDPSNLIVDTETRWSGHPAPGYTNGFVVGCAPEREFTPELDVTFVVGIHDSTTGNMVGADGLHNPNTGEMMEDEGSEFADGIDSATVVSPDGSFGDVELEWLSGLEDENTSPQWNGLLETQNLDPGTYSYEIEITDESTGQIDTGIASATFSIIEVPE
jgi:hypothetical protein